MLSVGEEIPQKCAQTKCRQIGNNAVYYNKEEENFHPCQNR